MADVEQDVSRTVVVLDADPAIAKGLSRLAERDGFSVVEALSYAGFLTWLSGARLTRPKGIHSYCVVMDVGLIDLEGEQTAPSPIRDIPRIYTGASALSAEVLNLIGQTFFKFVPKPFSLEEMREHVHLAFELHLNQMSSVWRITERFERLSAREYGVGVLVARGMTNQEIATQLGISIKTVKVHRAKVMKKLELDSVADLVRAFDQFRKLRGVNVGTPRTV